MGVECETTPDDWNNYRKLHGSGSCVNEDKALSFYQKAFFSRYKGP
jgi:hypothetical protein